MNEPLQRVLADAKTYARQFGPCLVILRGNGEYVIRLAADGYGEWHPCMDASDRIVRRIEP